MEVTSRTGDINNINRSRAATGDTTNSNRITPEAENVEAEAAGRTEDAEQEAEVAAGKEGQ